MHTSKKRDTHYKYEGFMGALTYGSWFLFYCILTISALSIFLWVYLGLSGFSPGIYLCVMFISFLAFLGATASRYVCGWRSNSLMSIKFQRGDLAAFGFLFAVFLSGYLALYSPVLSPKEESPVELSDKVEFSGSTLNDRTFYSEAYRGKVLVVDFCASWCPPCHAEMGYLKEVYETYPKEKVQIVTVSLDESKDQAMNFAEQYKTPWPNIYFSGYNDGFDNPLAKKYGVNAIPYVMILDEKGKVAAKNVRSSEITYEVAKTMGSPVSVGDFVWAKKFRAVECMFAGIVFAPIWLLTLYVIFGVGLAVVFEFIARELFDSYKVMKPALKHL